MSQTQKNPQPQDIQKNQYAGQGAAQKETTVQNDETRNHGGMKREPIANDDRSY